MDNPQQICYNPAISKRRYNAVVFYEVRLKTLPKLLFAVSLEYAQYHGAFPHHENLLELCVIEQGSIRFLFPDGREELASAGMLSPVFTDMVCRTQSASQELQKHTTVGVQADYTATRRDSAFLSDRERMEVISRVREGCTILIPYQHPLGDRFHAVRDSILRISALHHAAVPGEHTAFLSEWFRLTTLLTQLVLSRLRSGGVSPSPTAGYVQEAEEYIRLHYRENLRVETVADALGISAGYLHKLFREATGETPIGYLNRFRVELVKEYVSTQGLTLSEAARQVGVNDPAYMSRLFRSATGVSFQEYMRRSRR